MCIKKGGAADEAIAALIDHLRYLSFLGIQTGDNDFEYIFDMRTEGVAAALARRRAEEGEPVTYEIHPAFRRYLEVKEGT